MATENLSPLLEELTTPVPFGHSRSIVTSQPEKLVLADTKATPIFCCTQCMDFINAKDLFVDFNEAAAREISIAESWRAMFVHDVHHVIELDLSSNGNAVKPTSRYFVCLNPAREYREVDAEFFSFFKERKKTNFSLRSSFTCQEHNNDYQLLRYEHKEDVNEGHGLKTRELSPQKVSREKRNIMLRKLSYGRKDEIQEVVKKRKMSCGDVKIKVDPQLERLCRFVTESRLC